MKWQILLSLFIFSFLPYLISCGGTSETGNARIASLSGSILINDCDTTKVWVHLVNENYIPGTDTSEMVYKVAVDPEGEYHFNSVQWNNYFLYIKGRNQNLLRGPFPVSIPELELGKDTLHYTSKVTVNIPDSADLDFVFIRGVPELYNVVSGKAILPNVPEGSLEIIVRSNQNSSKPLDTIDLERTILLDVVQGDTVSVGLHSPPPVFDKTPAAMSRTVNIDCSKRYQDVLLVENTPADSLTFAILQAPPDLRLNTSNGVITWTVPDTFINRAVTIGAVAENSSGSSRSIWWTVTFNNTCSLTVAKPNHPTGPDSGIINNTMYFYADSTDQKMKLLYRFFWGDSLVSQWNAVPGAMHSWSTPGTYEVRIQAATIDTSILSTLSDPLLVSIGIQENIQSIPRPKIILSADTVPTGQNLYISIINDSCDSFYTYVNFDDTLDTLVSSSLPLTHSWDKPGIYPIYFTFLCKPFPDTLTDTLIINVVMRNTKDTTPPVMKLFGPSDTTISVNTPYQDAGAIAIDDIDGDISFSITTQTNINISKGGSYYYLYNAKDAAGNVATVMRKIVVK